MRHLPRPLSGPLAARTAVAALSLATLSLSTLSLGTGSAMAAVSHAAGHPAAARHDAAAQQARVIARASIRRLTARWVQGTRQSPGGPSTAQQGSVSSTTWGGYADTSETYSKVSGKWAQPKLACSPSSTALFLTWVGIDGYSSSSVEQAGTLAECYEGSAYYYSWWEMYPTNSIQVVGESVAVGDAITGSVSRSGSTYTLKVTDATHTANSFTTTHSCSSCANASAEWIAESDSGYTGLPAGTSWTESGATVTAGTVTGVISTFPYVQIVPVGGSTSMLNAAGNGFTVTW